MKLVRENINEKFKEQSDPIHDMGIGIELTIKQFCEEKEPSEATNKHNWIWICVLHKRKDYVEYLINNGWDINYNPDPILYAIINDDFDMIKLLLDNGAKINTRGIWKRIRNNHPETYKFILNYKGVKRIRESINEKFEEKSDPIQDMGVGGINLGRIRTELKIEYRKKILKTYKDLIIKKTITGKFNEMIIVKDGEMITGRGWGTYTIFVDMIFNTSEINEESVSISVFDNKKNASYIIPITDEKIFIK